MKICPNCKQTYADDGLNFCLSDGSPLAPLTDEATPTVYMDPPRTTNQTRWEQPPVYDPPAVWQGQHDLQNQTVNAPMRIESQNQTLAIISLALGILGILICCGGIPLGAGAVVTGAIALNQEKNDPARYGGRNLAMAGIITGAVAMAIAIGFMFV